MSCISLTSPQRFVYLQPCYSGAPFFPLRDQPTPVPTRTIRQGVEVKFLTKHGEEQGLLIVSSKHSLEQFTDSSLAYLESDNHHVVFHAPL